MTNKICWNCRNFLRGISPDTSYCRGAMEGIHPVTGEAIYLESNARRNREVNGACGPEAKLYKEARWWITRVLGFPRFRGV